MLVSKSIPNLINGVSQQPDSLRSESQATAQENAYPSLVEGLTKRLPTEHVGEIVNAASEGSTEYAKYSNAFTHMINRDAAERYVFMLNTDGDAKVYDIINKTTRTVTQSGATTTYLQATNPSTAFKAVTIADVTFLVNTEKTTAMLTDPSDLYASRNPEALVWVRSGNYASTYKVTGTSTIFDGTEASFTTSNTDVTTIATDNIASELFDDMATAGGDPFTITRNGSVIHIQAESSSDFNIDVTDSNGNNDIFVFKDSVQLFSDLPTVAPQGFVIKVTGDPEVNIDDYYVKFVAKDGVFGEGVWEETFAPGSSYKLDKTTMPHVLIRNAGGTPTFTLRRADTGDFNFADRLVGDTTTNPNPSFIGQTISDVFLYKNRLGFLSGESIVLSESGQFFNFFRTTVTQILDSMPIDVVSSHSKISLFKNAIPFAEKLLLFSDFSQFTVEGSPILSPTTIQVTPITDYENITACAPKSTGRSIMFAFDRGGFSGIQEYIPSGDGETFQALDITANVPKYINGSISKIATSTHERVVVCKSSSEDSTLFLYNYYNSGRERLQSAWHKFSFGSDTKVLDFEFIDSSLFLVIHRTDGIFLEELKFESGLVDTGSTYYARLDRRITHSDLASRSYNSTTNETTITLPYKKAPGRSIEIITTAGSRIAVKTQSDSSNSIVVANDVTSTDMFLGEAYTMSYTFSNIVFKEATRTGGNAIITDGRIQLRYGNIVFDSTGFFTVTVTPVNRDANTHNFTGNILGSAVIGTVNITSGEFRFPVYSKADQATIVLTNDTPLPSNFMSAEFECEWSPTLRRARY